MEDIIKCSDHDFSKKATLQIEYQQFSSSNSNHANNSQSGVAHHESDIQIKNDDLINTPLEDKSLDNTERGLQRFQPDEDIQIME
jgi:hypothetical protein